MKHFYTVLACLMLLGTSAATAQRAIEMKKAPSATLTAPGVNPATNITASGFTANWQPVDGAEAYCVFVYIKDVMEQDGEFTLADEDFDGIDFGSLIEPAGGDESGVNLSQMGYALSYGWEAYLYPTFAPSLVAGMLYTPYLYLVNNDGKYKVHITTYASRNDEIRVTSHGIGDAVNVAYNVELDNSQATGVSTKTIELSNGSRDLFMSMINNTAQLGVADYFDRVKVTQDLKEGDEVYTNIDADEAVMAQNDWGDDVTSKRFTLNSAYLNGHTEVYYDVYAARYEGYTLVVSPYSNRVLVDLRNRTSEVIDDATAITSIKADARQAADDNWYDLTGRRVLNPGSGIYIHNGKKVVR